jgi:murein L,D-transpeptidase YafK
MSLLHALLAFGITVHACASVKPADLEAAARRLRAAAKEAGVPYPLATVEIRIHKAPHVLELRSGNTVVKSYVIGLGHRGLSDKRRQGDHLTPEGRFFVCNRNEQSAFHLFLGLSYPHEAAAARGLQGGLITRSQHDAILSALRGGRQPIWNSALGGAVGLHGGGSSSDWTWGCIALENGEMDELWVACAMGTPVIIEAQ